MKIITIIKKFKLIESVAIQCCHILSWGWVLGSGRFWPLQKKIRRKELALRSLCCVFGRRERKTEWTGGVFQLLNEGS